MGSLGESVTHGRVQVLPANSTTLASLLPENVRGRQDLVLAMPYHVSRRLPPPPPAPRGVIRYFSPLDSKATLDRAFEGTSFVEFPQVQVFTVAEWQSRVGNGRIAVIGREVKTVSKPAEAPPAKKQKVDGMALAGLGDYGDSDDDEEVEGVINGASVAEEGRAVEKGQAQEGPAGEEGQEGDEEQDGEEDEEGHEEGEAEETEEGGDVTLAPEMAAALGAALVADFGE